MEHPCARGGDSENAATAIVRIKVRLRARHGSYDDGPTTPSRVRTIHFTAQSRLSEGNRASVPEFPGRNIEVWREKRVQKRRLLICRDKSHCFVRSTAIRRCLMQYFHDQPFWGYVRYANALNAAPHYLIRVPAAEVHARTF
jgi:hypothetical protein